MSPMSIYFTLIITTGILFLFEIIMPGGILGFLGAATLFAAGVLGFQAFGPEGGMVSAFLLLVGLGIYAMLVVKVLPHSSFGRMFTLSNDLKDSHAAGPRFDDLLGQSGSAITDLRPSGIVRFGTRRVDVVAEGKWIEKDAKVKVIQVEGNVVTVRETLPL